MPPLCIAEVLGKERDGFELWVFALSAWVEVLRLRSALNATWSFPPEERPAARIDKLCSPSCRPPGRNARCSSPTQPHFHTQRSCCIRMGSWRRASTSTSPPWPMCALGKVLFGSTSTHSLSGLSGSTSGKLSTTYYKHGAISCRHGGAQSCHRERRALNIWWLVNVLRTQRLHTVLFTLTSYFQ